ncbi:unnamed protein product, partial [Mesorhabditis belari]|uniref:G-protein coupled receptors family 1 profile domain-containing protein n=1 Tax=Mesorhabditis belari TaxID=2138241 RepID=A0AAF3EN38_9BILA
MAIAINRFFHICTKVETKTTLLIAKTLHFIAWCFALLIVLVPSLYGCFKVFSPRLFAYTFACGDCGDLYQQVYTLAGAIIPGSILLIYALIILWIQFRKREISVNYSLTMQCFLITVPALIAPPLFFSMSSWFPGNAYVGIIPMTWTGLAMLANPTVYFVFNDSVKRAMLCLMCRERKVIFGVTDNSKSLTDKRQKIVTLH